MKGFLLSLLRCCAAVTAMHVFKERSNREHLPHIIPYVSRADMNAPHSVVFAVANRNMEGLTEVLNDVSDPSSVNYGKHWTKQEVVDFTLNGEAYEAVMNYISSTNEVVVNKKTLHGEYIFATAPVHFWENMFATTFHVYEVEENHIIRAEEYSLPAALYDHVSTVLNTVQFHPPNMLEKKKVQQRPISSSSKGLSSENDPASSTIHTATQSIPFGTVTPALIKSFYSVPNNITGSKLVTQAVYESNGGRFCQQDLRSFEDAFGLPHQHVSIIVRNQDDDSNDNVGGDDYNTFLPCDLNAPAHGASDLDVQYITAIAPGARTFLDYSTEWMLAWITSVVNSETPANVYSIGYYSSEKYLPLSYITTFNTEAIKLGVMGSTIVVTSGDDGASSFHAINNPSQCGYTAFFPAVSPYVLTVGATRGPEVGIPEVACQSGTGNFDPSSLDHFPLITTGGGFSTVSPLPSWQSDAVKGYLAAVNGTSKQPYTSSASSFNKQGRGYPDVSLLGHNYEVFYNGGINRFDLNFNPPVASASTPVMAAFVTLVNAQRKSHGLPTMGWINPFLYKYHADFINDITVGDNKCTSVYFVQPNVINNVVVYQFNHTCCKEGFHATAGWDPVTGLGSVNFDKFLKSAMRVPGINGFAPSASPTTSQPHPSPAPINSPAKKICQFGGYCLTAADCVAGNKCRVQSPYYSQCVAEPTTYTSNIGCVSNNAAKCSAASQCCDPGAYCSLTNSFPQCQQPTSASGQCINPSGYASVKRTTLAILDNNLESFSASSGPFSANGLTFKDMVVVVGMMMLVALIVAATMWSIRTKYYSAAGNKNSMIIVTTSCSLEANL